MLYLFVVLQLFKESLLAFTIGTQINRKADICQFQLMLLKCVFVPYFAKQTSFIVLIVTLFATSNRTLLQHRITPLSTLYLLWQFKNFIKTTCQRPFSMYNSGGGYIDRHSLKYGVANHAPPPQLYYQRQQRQPWQRP